MRSSTVKAATELKEKILKKYPTPELREVALAFADRVIPQDNFDAYDSVYDIRNLDFIGSFVDSNIFMKQAAIVREYNNFNINNAKKLTEIFGEDAKYRLY